jgi:hypothetical protein
LSSVSDLDAELNSAPDSTLRERRATILELSSEKAALHSALHLRNPQLATMYLGSIRVIADASIPDRLPLAAHGLRE